jgi:hypothetical protein
MICPICGDKLLAGHDRAVAPANWLDCLRRCPRCQVGFSNTWSNPTILYNDPRLNVPLEVREGLLETLAMALNERNRANKRAKFGFSTSEDALTWVVFKYLHDSGQLLGVLRRAGLAIPYRAFWPEAMLLWGVPIPLDRTGQGWWLREYLEEIGDRLGEDPRSRTEPDVVIDLGPDGIFIIEVKHRSGTAVKSGDYAGWDRYYPAVSPLTYAASMRSSGCYELARNWRFGLELAAEQARPFTLACLGPDDLFLGDGAKIILPFEACLPGERAARFQKLTWADLLGAIEHPPEWFVRCVESRGYTISAGGL